MLLLYVLSVMCCSCSSFVAGHFNVVVVCLLQVALDKLFRFATSHVFETEVAGRMCADMCAAAAKVMYELRVCNFACMHTLSFVLCL